LKEKGADVKLDALLSDLKVRDERDKSREIAPLVPAEDAYVLDSTDLTISQVLDAVLNYTHSKLR